MLITCLSLKEDVDNLDLRGKIVEGDRLITNRAPSKVGVHTNMFGQFMLGGISDNLKSPSVVTVKRSGGGDRHTKVL